MVTEADSFKEIRANAVALANAGVSPLLVSRPKRKRGFHRALKRGEQWAIYDNTQRKLMEAMARYSVNCFMQPLMFGEKNASTKGT